MKAEDDVFNKEKASGRARPLQPDALNVRRTIMRKTLIVALLGAFCASGCSEDSSIVQSPPSNGPDVLLSDDFDNPPDPGVWRLLDSCDGLSKPDGEGNLTLMVCDYPAWVTSSLLSQQEWIIEPGKTYTVTLRIGTPDCLSWGASLGWGLQCYSGDTFLGELGFYAGLTDIVSVFVKYIKQFGPCSAPSDRRTDVCSEFHDYILVISDTKIEAFIDDVLQNRIDLVDECEGDIESFKIVVGVSARGDQRKVLIDKITLERSQEE